MDQAHAGLVIKAISASITADSLVTRLAAIGVAEPFVDWISGPSLSTGKKFDSTHLNYCEFDTTVTTPFTSPVAVTESLDHYQTGECENHCPLLLQIS